MNCILTIHKYVLNPMKEHCVGPFESKNVLADENLFSVKCTLACVNDDCRHSINDPQVDHLSLDHIRTFTTSQTLSLLPNATL